MLWRWPWSKERGSFPYRPGPSMTSRKTALRPASASPCDLPCLCVAAGLVLYLAGQLAAGGVNIVAPRLASGSDDAGIHQKTLEALYRLGFGAAETSSSEWIERDQIELARHVTHQGNELLGMTVSVVD